MLPGITCKRVLVRVGLSVTGMLLNMACALHLMSSLSHSNLLDDELLEFSPVLCLDVRKVIMAIPNNKAPGYDKVSVSVIKDCLPHILSIIASIINLSLESSTFPHAWKKAEIVAHLKEGDHEVPDNNRPISLLPVLSKVAEKLLYNSTPPFCQIKTASPNTKVVTRDVILLRPSAY